jgi:hypothetical protein
MAVAGPSGTASAPIVSGAHRFEKIVDGIYYPTACGAATVDRGTRS